MKYLSATKNAIYQRKRTERIKSELMTKLGNVCVICGISDLRVLTIHHIKNDGAEHRKVVGGRGGIRFYEYLLKNGITSNLECRCFSCNDFEAWS